MNGESPKTRYHAEVKVVIEGRECRINAFRDTLDEIFQDIGTIASQFPQDWKSPAKREIVNAELKAEQLRKDAPVPQKGAHVPTCAFCKSAAHMELIKFTDKTTGEAAQAWKCQDCKKWHFPNGNRP